MNGSLIVLPIGIMAALLITFVTLMSLAISKQKSDSSSSSENHPGDGATIKLQFNGQQQQGQNQQQGQKNEIKGEPFKVKALVTPTYVGIKFVAAYLAEDINPDQSNLGRTEMIYLNPECQGEIGNCDVDPGQGFPIVIQDFFDFSQSPEQVNAQLNAQEMSIEPGTYRYLRLEFCRRGSEQNPDTYSDNFEFEIEGMTQSYGYAIPACGVTVALDPPLVISGGETITLTLNYDLTDSVNTFDTQQDGVNCTETSPYCCLNQITFNPSITVN